MSPPRFARTLALLYALTLAIPILGLAPTATAAAPTLAPTGCRIDTHATASVTVSCPGPSGTADVTSTLAATSTGHSFNTNYPATAGVTYRFVIGISAANNAHAAVIRDNNVNAREYCRITVNNVITTTADAQSTCTLVDSVASGATTRRTIDVVTTRTDAVFSVWLTCSSATPCTVATVWNPSAPSGLITTHTHSNGYKVLMLYGGGTPGATSYDVWHRADSAASATSPMSSSTYTLIGNLAPAAGATATQTFATTTTSEHHVRFTAKNTDGEGPASVDYSTVAAPTALASSSTAVNIGLAWTPSTTSGVTSHEIHRSTTPGFTASSGNTLATIGTNTTFVDADILPATTYCYQVVAVRTSDGYKSLGSNEVCAETPITDDTGLGGHAIDAHRGANAYKTHIRPESSQDIQWTGSAGAASQACKDEDAFTFQAQLVWQCAWDGESSTYTQTASPSPTGTCVGSLNSATFTFREPRPVKELYTKIRLAATSSGDDKCLLIQYKAGASWLATSAGTRANLANNQIYEFWDNLTSVTTVSAIRYYVGDYSGNTITTDWFELDAYDLNGTYYPYTLALGDAMARYSSVLETTTSIPTLTSNVFLPVGAYYFYVTVPYSTSPRDPQRWTITAPGPDWQAELVHYGHRMWSWEIGDPGDGCQYALYKVTNSVSSKTFTLTTPLGTDRLCRITGAGQLPSPYETAADKEIKANLAARGYGTGEVIGRVYFANALPFYPALDSDMPSVIKTDPDAFVPGPIILPTGEPGQKTSVSLAKYPMGWAGNGIFIALGQEDAACGGGISSTHFEIYLNGFPAWPVWNDCASGYEVAIFYLDDQAKRRNLTEPDTSDVLEGNSRIGRALVENYEFEIRSGFDPTKPIRTMRTFGLTGHQVFSCYHFCSANVRPTVFKLPAANANRIELTIVNDQNVPVSGARVTDNFTGAFYITDATGKVVLTNRFKDTLFEVSADAYRTKCLAFEYATRDGSEIVIIEQACAQSPSYPKFKAQNLVHTLVLYPIDTPPPPSTTTFDEVPVEIVTKPVQGITFRGNLTRIAPDTVTIQVQRNASEDLKLTVFRFEARTGALQRVTAALDWPRTSSANPLLVTYPGGRATDASDEGGYHLMVQRGTTYVTGVSFKILANWTHLNSVPQPGDVTGIGDGLAEDVARDQEADREAAHKEALQNAANRVDTAGALAQAVWIVPVLLLLLFVGLILRNMT